MESEGRTVDHLTFAKTEVLRQKLRQVRDTIRCRENFLRREENIYLMVATERRWTSELEEAESRMDGIQMELDIFRRREQEILVILSGYPKIYRDELAHELDSASRTSRDC